MDRIYLKEWDIMIKNLRYRNYIKKRRIKNISFMLFLLLTSLLIGGCL